MATETERFAMFMSPELIAAVDEWRRKQPDLPSRAEAVRRLLQQALGKSSKR